MAQREVVVRHGAMVHTNEGGDVAAVVAEAGAANAAGCADSDAASPGIAIGCETLLSRDRRCVGQWTCTCGGDYIAITLL